MKQWRADGGSFLTLPWTRQPGDGDAAIEDNDIEEIDELIRQRGVAKQAADYERADAIKEELRVKHKVVLDDKRRGLPP